MSAITNNLAEKTVQLPVEDRAYLADRLLASLDEADLQEQWIEEARHRRDEVRSGLVKPVAAEDVYRRIDELLK